MDLQTRLFVHDHDEGTVSSLAYRYRHRAYESGSFLCRGPVSTVYCVFDGQGWQDRFRIPVGSLSTGIYRVFYLHYPLLFSHYSLENYGEGTYSGLTHP